MLPQHKISEASQVVQTHVAGDFSLSILRDQLALSSNLHRCLHRMELVLRPNVCFDSSLFVIFKIHMKLLYPSNFVP